MLKIKTTLLRIVGSRATSTAALDAEKDIVSAYCKWATYRMKSNKGLQGGRRKGVKKSVAALKAGFPDMSIPGTSGGSVENANSELAERVIIVGSVQDLLQSVLQELKSDREERKSVREELKSVRASVGSLRAATLPVSLAIAVKAGITTLAVAKTIAGASPHPTTYSSCLNVLQQLSYVQKGHTIQPGPLTGFHALRAASTMMAKPLSHNPLSQPRLHLYVQLEQELSRVGIYGQDITDAFMLVDQGDQVRQDRNSVAHEMTIGTFLANFKCQMEVVNENLIVPVSWMKLQVLWKDVIGQDMLASAHAAEAGGIAPADLNICLYNISSTQTV